MIIYRTTNLINGKIYIGKDINSNPFYLGSGRILKNAIKKYGKGNFTKEILENCNSDNINEKERYWIMKYNSLYPTGYNLTLGGEGGDTFSIRNINSQNITRKKLSKSMKKLCKNKEYIKKLSGASKKNWENSEYINKVKSGLRNTMSTPEYKAKQSIIMKNVIKNKLDVWSSCKKGKRNGRWLGNICLMTPNGVVEKVFDSAVQMHEETGMASYNIRNKARSGDPVQRGKYKGYTIKFMKE